MTALTPTLLRTDLKCGKGAIPEGKKCTKGPATKAKSKSSNALGHTLAVGAVAAVGLGTAKWALGRKGLYPSFSTPRIKTYRVNFNPPSAKTKRPAEPPITPVRVSVIQPGNPRISGTASKALLPPQTRPRLPGSSPRGLLPPSPQRMSKTARMRSNTEAAMRRAEQRIAQTAREEVRRIAQVGNTMAAAGEASGMAAKTGWRELRLRAEAARRRYEPGYRRSAPKFPRLLRGSSQAPIKATLTPKSISPQRLELKDSADGKKYSKTVTNPATGRKRTVRYGATGYRIAPGTDKGDRYCARSFGDMRSHGKHCAGADRNTPLRLSRSKWKCSGKSSRRDGGLTPARLGKL